VSDFEFRPFNEPVEVRSAAGGRLVLSGPVIRYGARSRDAGVQRFGFRERILAGAATEVIQKSDVLALDEHRSERYLGRTGNGTLRLLDSKTELRYEVDLPDTAVGREVATLAERGDYRGSSFGFRSLHATWSKEADGTPLRTITAFKLLRDVGPTVAPVYETGAAEAALRNFSDEAGVTVELRSVLEAAREGHLAQLLDGAVPTPPVPLEPPAPVEPPAPLEPPAPIEAPPDPPVIHRRPAHWFV